MEAKRRLAEEAESAARQAAAHADVAAQLDHVQVGPVIESSNIARCYVTCSRPRRFCAGRCRCRHRTHHDLDGRRKHTEYGSPAPAAALLGAARHLATAQTCANVSPPLQADRAALAAQLAGAMQEVATAQAEAKAAREEAGGLAHQLEAAEQSKVGKQTMSHLQPHGGGGCIKQFINGHTFAPPLTALGLQAPPGADLLLCSDWRAVYMAGLVLCQDIS